MNHSRFGIMRTSPRRYAVVEALHLGRTSKIYDISSGTHLYYSDDLEIVIVKDKLSLAEAKREIALLQAKHEPELVEAAKSALQKK